MIINSPSNGEVLFLNASLEDGEKLIYKVNSEFDRSEKPNSYIFHLNKSSNLKTDKNIKQILLENDYSIENFRFSLQFYKPISLFGPIVIGSFIVEIKEEVLRARVTQKGIKSKKEFDLVILFEFNKFVELYDKIC